ncbi:hypothetical protein FJTKL_01759 [Diaporthe vaccinii]|uniref:Uncharacterized protein n=1 Tax=Diaporthe vaccinii TaxID=105482 RepID=A0ABR4F465_9PEZI
MATSPDIQLQRLGVLDLFEPSPSRLSPGPPRTPSPSGTSPRSCSLRANMGLFFDPAADTALFKVEAPVSLLNDEALVPATTQGLLHICPEQITSLAYSRLPRLPDRLAPVYTHLSERETLSLKLTISSPPTLIIPNLTGRLIPHTQSDLATLTAFQRIAGATTSTLTLTLYIPGTALTDAQASSICTGVTQSTTVAAAHTRLDRVFAGCGVRAVPLDKVTDVVEQSSPTTSPSTHASPPAYEGPESGQAPPVYDGKEKEIDRTQGRKRPRKTSSSPAGNPDGATADSLAGREEIWSQIQVLQRLLKDASSKIPRLEYLIAEADTKDATLRTRLTEADAKVVELIDATARCECEASEGRDAYIDHRMEELKEELTSHIDDRFDFLGVDALTRSEMEEFVEEQVGAAMEDLRERLAGGGVRVILPAE